MTHHDYIIVATGGLLVLSFLTALVVHQKPPPLPLWQEFMGSVLLYGMFAVIMAGLVAFVRLLAGA